MAGPRLTVLQLLPSLEGGGVEQGTVDMAEGLVEAGHRALVVSAGGPMVANVNAVGGEHVEMAIGAKTPLTLRYVPALKRMLREQKVDILHLRSRMPAWIGYFAWRALPVDRRPRLVSTVHGFYSVNRYSRIMLRGERVICVSRSIRDYVLSNYPETDPNVLTIVHRGVDPARYPHGFEADEGWLKRYYETYPTPPNCRTLLLPGRITRLKGHIAFLRLVARLRSEGRQVRGFIVGGVSPRRQRYARELADAITAWGLRGHVHMLGHRNDMRELMSVSDLVLSLSTQPESFGRTTLESLSLGRTTAGYAHGGVGEILDSLYPPGIVRTADEEHLYHVTHRLLADPPPVPDSHPFTHRRMIGRTLGVYRDLLASGPSQS